MITNKEIYGLHTSVDPDPSEYTKPTGMSRLTAWMKAEKTIPRCIPPAILQT